MRIDVSLSGDSVTICRKIQNVLLVCESAPMAVLAWLYTQRPLPPHDATLQRIYDQVDAACSVIKHAATKSDFNFAEAVQRVKALCATKLGEAN